jgi:hypothetical protein
MCKDDSAGLDHLDQAQDTRTQCLFLDQNGGVRRGSGPSPARMSVAAELYEHVRRDSQKKITTHTTGLGPD